MNAFALIALAGAHRDDLLREAAAARRSARPPALPAAVRVQRSSARRTAPAPCTAC